MFYTILAWFLLVVSAYSAFLLGVIETTNFKSRLIFKVPSVIIGVAALVFSLKLFGIL